MLYCVNLSALFKKHLFVKTNFKVNFFSDIINCNTFSAALSTIHDDLKLCSCITSLTFYNHLSRIVMVRCQYLLTLQLPING